MSASMLASFLVYVLVGIYTFIKTPLPEIDSITVRKLIFTIFILNAIFFYYYEAYSELDDRMMSSLRSAHYSEWILRVLNQSQLYLLWFWIQMGWDYFFLALIILYFCYIIWDIITWEAFPSHQIATLDFFGLLLSIGLFFTKLYLAKYDSFNQITAGAFLGILLVGFLVLNGLGLYFIRFNPLSSFKRENLN